MCESAAGRSSGGGYTLTGGFIAGAQMLREGSLAMDTAASAPPSLVASLAAVPTRGGAAEIVFALSAPAAVEVHVLNIAGRPVRTLCQAKACEAGTNALVWDAMSETGLRVPSGVYVIRIGAQSPDGGRNSALTTVRLER